MQFNGKIVLNTKPKFGLIGFGQSYEIFKRKRNCGEAVINGLLEINGKVQFGLDTKLYIKKNAVLKLGHINSFASHTEIICFKSISIGNWVQFGNDCLITDTNFHELKDLSIDTKLPMNKEISIGSYNFIGARSTIKGNTETPNNCLVGSNSLLNKNYYSFGENIILGGIPAKLIKENIVRDWETEKENLENYLTIKL
ncbi:hypothetical protein [Algoriella sp.]|uniref:hypothetical protein n=1 Tax=Algoriella sp. TaxID=1872434 RepID=UPI002FC64E63